MSWQATAWADALPYSVAGPMATRVLFKLANVAWEDGRGAFRSKKQLAEQLGVSERSIQRALRELEDAGLIIKGDQRLVDHLRGDRKPTVYDLPIHAAVQPTLDGETTGRQRGDTQPVDNRHGETHAVANGETTAVVHKNDHLNNLTTSVKSSTPVPSPGDIVVVGKGREALRVVSTFEGIAKGKRKATFAILDSCTDQTKRGVTAETRWLRVVAAAHTTAAGLASQPDESKAGR
ncbi:MAG: helix-turn-helix domain-containing protein [Pseudoclavibacter sp.]